jgi:transcriptional regulator with PAS, ATPase and Fis domain
MERHRKLEPSIVQITKTGQWFMIREYRTSYGGTFLIRTDVTDRKETEEALRESEQRLKTIIDTVPAIINVKDTESRYLLSNRYHKELFGLKGKDLIGKAPDVIETGEVIPYFDYSLTTAEGRKLDLRVTKAPLRDLSGKVIGTVTSGIDITDYRLAERELSHHKKMESLGYLAGGMAHNLNNMLQPILILGRKRTFPRGARTAKTWTSSARPATAPVNWWNRSPPSAASRSLSGKAPTCLRLSAKA